MLKCKMRKFRLRRGGTLVIAAGEYPHGNRIIKRIANWNTPDGDWQKLMRALKRAVEIEITIIETQKVQLIDDYNKKYELRKSNDLGLKSEA